MLRVLECFAGIGACSKALTNLDIEHEIVDAVEIDKYAIKAFNAIHGTNFGPQDITKWDKDIECDLIMHGSPCQDFSVAGKQAGGDKSSGTRSSLMYETLRIVEKLRPKYVIWENVKNLLSKKHRHNFDAYLEAMEKLGYKNHYQVLDAQNYGVPQHRERVFTVSIRVDIPYCWAFDFPIPIPLEKRLKDVLEKEVDEKYYLSSERLERIQQWEDRQKANGRGFRFNVTDGNGVGKTVSTSGDRPCSTNYIKVIGKLDIKGQDQIKRIYDTSGVSPTLSTMQGGNRQPKIAEGPTSLQRKVCDEALEKGLVKPNDAIEYTYSNARLREMDEGHIKKQNRANNQIMSTLKTNPQQIGICVRTANSKGYDVAIDGDGIDLAYPDSKTRRGRVGHGVSKTIPTSSSQGVLDGIRIRKLTPKECYRLMGFDDEDFEKAAKEISSTQLYKTAGNSIVVDVLMAIFKELFGV